MVKIKFLSLFLLSAIAACTTSDKPSNFDYGTIVNGQYKNTYFNFSINIPADWKVQSKEQTQALENQAKALVDGDKKLGEVIEAADITNATLLAVYKYDSGSMVAFNPSIMIVTESVTGARDIKNGNDYLRNTRKLIRETNLKYDSIDTQFVETALGGKSFHTMNTTSSALGIEVKQRFYASIINDFSLVIILSYSTRDQFEELMSMVGSMRFYE